MRKVIVGLLVAAVLGVGGYFGVVYWVERAAAREVDAVLDRMRARIGSASRGTVEFDLWSRTLKVSDIVVQSPTAPHPKITVERVVASGVDASGRAARVDISGLEVWGTWPGLTGVRVHQKAPRVTLTQISARPTAVRKIASAFDMLRFRLEQLSAIAAEKVEVPSLTMTVMPVRADRAKDGSGGTAEYVYSNVVLRDVRDGRIAEATVDRVDLHVDMGRRPFGGIRGKIDQVSVVDADLKPLLAVLDPSQRKSQPGGEGYRRVYRRIALGPYTANLGKSGRVRIDRVVAEDVGLDPARIPLDDILFLAEVAPPAGGPPPSLTQMSMVIDKMAGLYEGVRLGRLEMQGMSLVGPHDTVEMASLKLDRLENGRFARFSVEGLAGGSAIGKPIRLGRLTLQGLDISNLLRVIPSLATPGRGRSEGLAGVIAMLPLLAGVEIEDVVIPHRRTGRAIRLEALDASWGRFVGDMPTRSRLTVEFTGPVSAAGPPPFDLLAERGVKAIDARIDIGASWAEKEQAVTLAPAAVEISNMLSLSLKASVGNVQPEHFSANPMTVLGGAALAEVGPVEVSLRDLGAIELAAAALARAKGVPPSEGRALLLKAIAAKAETLAKTSSDAQPLLQALGELVQGKADTLTVRLTPKGRVRLLELAEAMKLDPAGALLAGFRVEATTAQ